MSPNIFVLQRETNKLRPSHVYRISKYSNQSKLRLNGIVKFLRLLKGY